jgi:hypothetical protein
MIDTALLVARVVGFATTSSVRPAATCFAAQLLAAGLVHFEVAALPAHAAWSVSPLALGVGLAACLLEWFLQHTEGADELSRALHADKLVSAALAMPTTLLLVSLTSLADVGVASADGALAGAGLPPKVRELVLDEAGRRADSALGNAPAASAAPAEDLALATSKLAASGRPPVEQAGFLALALVINLALTWVRGEVRDFVESIHLERIWAWLETGGAFAGLALLALAPAVGLALVVLLAAGSVALWIGTRAAAAVADAARRRACPSCSKNIRVEAQRCRFCHAEVEPLKWLGQAPAALAPAALTTIATD